jgi:hypothetical protein
MRHTGTRVAYGRLEAALLLAALAATMRHTGTRVALQLRLPLRLSYAGLSPFGVRASDCG